MPIASFKSGAIQPSEPNLPKIAPDDYKGVVVDNKYTDLHSLTRFVEGYPLTITYYGQIVGENNDVREIDPGQSGVYQQYYKVHKLDIRVDKPLELTYNNDNGLSSITGSANVYPDITPNTFDYFITETTRGRPTLFRITEVTRKSMNRDSVHELQYQMVGYIDRPGDGKILFESLESKVKRNYYFHGDRLLEGASPLLKDEEHNYVVELTEDYYRISSYYFETFFNQGYSTLVVPGQPESVYDKFVCDFILKIVSVQDNAIVDRVKQLGSDKDPFMAQPQFWKAIAERNPLYIYQANKFMGLVDRRTFVRDNYIAGAGSSMINQYVYPFEPDLSTQLPADQYPKLPGPGLQDTAGANNNIVVRGTNQWQDATGITPLYKRVLNDIYYVLSRDFYETQDNWCVLEKLTWDYLNGKSLALNQLSALVKQYYTLHRLEQFYYGPLLLTFIKDVRFDQYTER